MFSHVCVKMFFLLTALQKYKNQTSFSRVMITHVLPHFFVKVPNLPAQESAKYRAKFGWPPLTDVGAATKPRRETRWNLLGCPKPEPTDLSRYCEDMWWRYCRLTSFSHCRCMPQLRRYSPAKLCDGAQMANFCVLLYFQWVVCSTFHTCILNSH